MKAGIRKGFFGAMWSFTTNHPSPSFAPSGKNQNDVLIKVHASGINPVDYKLPKMIVGPVVGLDVAGVVDKIGNNVKNVKVGDAVFGTTMNGGLAEYTVASVNKIAKKSDTLSFDEAAALPTAYVTGLQGLRVGKVKEGSSVLVIGASGGCGIAALHLCKGLGVKRVVAICSERNVEFVKEAGATEVVDYTNKEALEQFFKDNEEKFDCVYDAATGSGKGENYTDKSMPLLVKDVGEYVQLNGGACVWLSKIAGRSVPHRHLILTDMNTADLEEVVSLLEKGASKPVLTKKPFSEEGVKDALELLQSRRTKGKIVFNIASAS